MENDKINIWSKFKVSKVIIRFLITATKYENILMSTRCLPKW